jgi:hypothetical protein
MVLASATSAVGRANTESSKFSFGKVGVGVAGGRWEGYVCDALVSSAQHWGSRLSSLLP